MIVSVDTRFMLVACYGQSEYHSMTETNKNCGPSRSLASPPKLATLPPTNEAFGENVVSPPANSYLSPAAEVGNPASLDKVLSLLIISLWDKYAITSKWVWSSYPWAIKNIQDGCRKTGQICEKRCSFLVESMKLHILGF